MPNRDLARILLIFQIYAPHIIKQATVAKNTFAYGQILISDMKMLGSQF